MGRSGTIHASCDRSPTPFDRDAELCSKLHISNDGIALLRDASKYEVRKDWLPGQPSAALDATRLPQCLRSEFRTVRLDALAPHLWLVAKMDSSHISPLTHQKVRGRRIIITEDPDMHLVWFQDRVFIKPLPEYLLSYAFWAYCMHTLDVTTVQSLLGFLRSYSYLIRHKSDFILATADEHRLLPKRVRYSKLLKLLEMANHRAPDTKVSPRWQFGELRLSRLNFWTKVYLRQFTYAKVHKQYSDYVAQYYGPLLFVFALLSVILSAMQVGLAVQTDPFFVRILSVASKGFVIFALVLVATLIAYVGLAVSALALREIIFATRQQRGLQEKQDQDFDDG